MSGSVDDLRDIRDRAQQLLLGGLPSTRLLNTSTAYDAWCAIVGLHDKYRAVWAEREMYRMRAERAEEQVDGLRATNERLTNELLGLASSP